MYKLFKDISLLVMELYGSLSSRIAAILPGGSTGATCQACASRQAQNPDINIGTTEPNISSISS